MAMVRFVLALWDHFRIPTINHALIFETEALCVGFFVLWNTVLFLPCEIVKARRHTTPSSPFPVMRNVCRSSPVLCELIFNAQAELQRPNLWCANEQQRKIISLMHLHPVFENVDLLSLHLKGKGAFGNYTILRLSTRSMETKYVNTQ